MREDVPTFSGGTQGSNCNSRTFAENDNVGPQRAIDPRSEYAVEHPFRNKKAGFPDSGSPRIIHIQVALSGHAGSATVTTGAIALGCRAGRVTRACTAV